MVKPLILFAVIALLFICIYLISGEEISFLVFVTLFFFFTFRYVNRTYIIIPLFYTAVFIGAYHFFGFEASASILLLFSTLGMHPLTKNLCKKISEACLILASGVALIDVYRLVTNKEKLLEFSNEVLLYETDLAVHDFLAKISSNRNADDKKNARIRPGFSGIYVSGF